MLTPYKQLVACEKQLRSCFITKQVKLYPTTNVSQFRLRSYRILTHAEIEYYIESAVLRKVDGALKKWVEKKEISNCIAILLAYTKKEFPNVSSSLAEITQKNDISFRINYAIDVFVNEVKQNNGIKEQNIIPLLVPLGINYPNISQHLLNNLSSFGQERGNTAHKSSKVQQLINPSDEILMVDHIINELGDLDKLILEIK